jgi:hypothetical protein
MLDMSETLEVSQPEMSPLKELAPKNMPLMSVTLLVSQVERSPIKELAPSNMKDMSVTTFEMVPETVIRLDALRNAWL